MPCHHNGRLEFATATSDIVEASSHAYVSCSHIPFVACLRTLTGRWIASRGQSSCLDSGPVFSVAPV